MRSSFAQDCRRSSAAAWTARIVRRRSPHDAQGVRPPPGIVRPQIGQLWVTGTAPAQSRQRGYPSSFLREIGRCRRQTLHVAWVLRRAHGSQMRPPCASDRTGRLVERVQATQITGGRVALPHVGQTGLPLTIRPALVNDLMQREQILRVTCGSGIGMDADSVQDSACTERTVGGPVRPAKTVDDRFVQDWFPLLPGRLAPCW